MKKTLLLLFTLISFLEVVAQTINGTITDIENLPLDLVNISVQNKSNGVTSDIEGNFSIQISPNRSNIIL